MNIILENHINFEDSFLWRKYLFRNFILFKKY